MRELGLIFFSAYINIVRCAYVPRRAQPARGESADCVSDAAYPDAQSSLFPLVD